MNTKPVAVYFGESPGHYGFGGGHPFGPDRIQAFWRETVKQGLNKRIHVANPQICEEEAIQVFHTKLRRTLKIHHVISTLST